VGSIDRHLAVVALNPAVSAFCRASALAASARCRAASASSSALALRSTWMRSCRRRSSIAARKRFAPWAAHQHACSYRSADPPGHRSTGQQDLPPWLGGEPRRMYIRHKDLDRSHLLTAKPYRL
jgi:hypothetical protein